MTFNYKCCRLFLEDEYYFDKSYIKTLAGLLVTLQVKQHDEGWMQIFEVDAENRKAP